MRRTTITLTFLLLCPTAGACASIAGLDSFSKSSCGTGECDASLADTSPGEDANDGSSQADTSNPKRDGGSDGSDAMEESVDFDSSKKDAPEKDAPSDTKGDRTTEDAGDCGDPDTVKNCGACGVACGQANAVEAGCTGTKCEFECRAGHSDCNSGTAPNTDGCECATPGCCSGQACQTSRTNGNSTETFQGGGAIIPALGQTYYACDPDGDWQVTDALAACAAWVTQFGGNPATACAEWLCKASLPKADSVCYTTFDDAGTETCTGPCWGYSYHSPTYGNVDAGAGTVSQCSPCDYVIGPYN